MAHSRAIGILLYAGGVVLHVEAGAVAGLGDGVGLSDLFGGWQGWFAEARGDACAQIGRECGEDAGIVGVGEVVAVAHGDGEADVHAKRSRRRRLVALR